VGSRREADRSDADQRRKGVDGRLGQRQSPVPEQDDSTHQRQAASSRGGKRRPAESICGPLAPIGAVSAGRVLSAERPSPIENPNRLGHVSPWDWEAGGGPGGATRINKPQQASRVQTTDPEWLPEMTVSSSRTPSSQVLIWDPCGSGY
jgi:hypothetical protein